jgi:PPIC-type PPIASE domain
MIARRFRRFAVPLAVSVVGLGLTGCSSATSDAATITYRDSAGSHTLHISRSEFKKELAELVGSKQFQSFLTSNNFTLLGDGKNTAGNDFSAIWLAALVQQSAFDAEFSTLDLRVSATALDGGEKAAKQLFPLSSEVSQDAQGNATFTGTGIVLASFPKSLQNVLIAQRARQEALVEYYSSLTPEKEQAFFDEFANTICPSARVVAHILVKDLSTANGILAQLRGGASFGDLAAAQSTDTASAKTGGVVGCLRPETFVKEFDAAASAAPFGVPSGPVKSKLGYHVILITHPTFADFRSQIIPALQQNPLIARDLRLRAMHVWINPQFGTGALVTDSQGQLRYRVTPPAAPAVRDQRERVASTSTTTVSLGG